MTEEEVRALMARPWPRSCGCGVTAGSLHTPGHGGSVAACIHDLRATAAHLAPFALARVRDRGWVRLFADAIACECECGCRAPGGTMFQADRGPGFLCHGCGQHQPAARGDGWEILHAPATASLEPA
jgi:hypothetical protein